MKKFNKDNIQTFFQSDRAILMACIGIALIFWIFVKLSHTFQTSRDIAIEYTLPEGKTFVETPPQIITALLKGTGWDLIGDFSDEDTKIHIDLPDEPSFTINSSFIENKISNQLSDLEVLNINYDYLILSIESEASKKIPINLKWNSTFAPAYQLRDSIQIQPDSITISGPGSLLEPIVSWSTEVLALTNLKKDFSGNIATEKPQNDQITVNPARVKIDIPIEQFTEKSIFVPINVKNAPDSLKIFPEIVQLTCVVGLSKYEEVNKNNFSLEVDLKNIPLKTENNTLPIQLLQFPSFVRNIKLNKQSVEFFFVQ